MVILWGGFTTNFVWCVFLIVKNKTGGEFFKTENIPRLSNYVFSAIAGTTWYFQFFFYGMGTTKMGQYDFSSWTLHMAFIIIFSNLWGILLHEWRGTGSGARSLITAGILVLILSTIVVGFGNYLAEQSEEETPVEAIESSQRTLIQFCWANIHSSASMFSTRVRDQFDRSEQSGGLNLPDLVAADVPGPWGFIGLAESFFGWEFQVSGESVDPLVDDLYLQQVLPVFDDIGDLHLVGCLPEDAEALAIQEDLGNISNIPKVEV